MIWVTKHIIRLNTLETRTLWDGYDFAYFSKLLFIYDKDYVNDRISFKIT